MCDLLVFKLQVEMLSHFGSEHYCPLSLLRVHGSSMMEELEDHETDGQEDGDNTDSDSDVPVLPPEPGAKVEEESKKPNLLERAADTVINLVKKFTGNGHDKEKGSDVAEEGDDSHDVNHSSNGVGASESESQDEGKGKLVTLVGHEELVENPDENNASVAGAEQVPGDKRDTSQGESVSVNISSEESSSCKETRDQGDSQTASTAFSPCHLFSQVIGQYSLGCFMGRLLFSKNKNFTISMAVAKGWNVKQTKTSPTSDSETKNESSEKSDDQGEVHKQEITVQEKPSAVESLVEGSVSSEEINQKVSVIIPEPPSSNVEIKGESTVSSPSEGVHIGTVDVSSRIVQPSQSIDTLLVEKQDSEMSNDKTPALVEVSVVTAVPLNTTQSASSTVTLQSSESPAFKDSNVDVAKEPNLDSPKVNNEQLVKQSSSSSQSIVLDSERVRLVNKDTPQQPVVPLEQKDISSKSEEQSKAEENSKLVKDENESKGKEKPEATSSECTAPNSIHIMSQSSPDIDVLETKLDGREGTAQLPEEINVEKGPLPSLNGASTAKIVTDSSSGNVEPLESGHKETPPDMENQESSIESVVSSTSVVESQSADPTIQPTSPPSIDTPDISDSVLPLAAPPIIADTSHELAAAASDASLDVATLSKAQQAAATSAGITSLAGSGGHKESIFVRLSNKIKTLEQNQNMSTLYMEQLSQR